VSWTVADVVAIIAVSIVAIMLGFLAYQQATFMSTATEVCSQVIDFDDNKTISVRDGNYVNTRVVYHGYDVCISKKTGNVTSRTDLGYGTELQIRLHGV